MNADYRKLFPILSRTFNNNKIIYLDSSATTLKPQCVIDSIVEYYSCYSGNVHRGLHSLSEIASRKVDESRYGVGSYINAFENEIIFTSNTTESFNLLSQCLPNDIKKIAIPFYEHNSLIAPFIQSREVVFFGNGPQYPLTIDELKKVIVSENPDCIAFSHVSHLSGVINDIESLSQFLHNEGIISIIDAAQSAAYLPIDVKITKCDFLAFSSHKMYGPTGVGILYGRQVHIDNLRPFNTGGGALASLTEEGLNYKSAPYLFEAGTPNISGIIGFHAAVKFINSYKDEMNKSIQQLNTYLQNMQLQTKLNQEFTVLSGSNGNVSLPIMTLIPKNKLLTSDQVSALINDQAGIMTRSGFHCSHLYFHNACHLGGGLRVSCSSYTTIDELMFALESILSEWY